MHLRGETLQCSAGDLANHLACRHLTELDRSVALGKLPKPEWRDPMLQLRRELGDRHEKAYVDHLRSQGLEVVDLGEHSDVKEAVRRTREAARAGAGVIVQAALEEGRWGGRPDLLVRVEARSALGNWAYEVADTKLAQETRASTVLQLALYADLLRTVQGRPAGRMHVVKPNASDGGFDEKEILRFTDVQAYYRFVRRRLEAFLAREDETYAEPVPHCEICRWWEHCDRRRHRDDHLSLVAGMQRLHAGELKRQGIKTLKAFATDQVPLQTPRRGRRETYVKLRAQAAVQLRGRHEEREVHELLTVEPGRGLTRLPEPTAGDVFLDFEGDPFVAGGGLEYLLGYASFESGELRYEALWATNRTEERRLIERFLDWVLERLERCPELYLYHFAPYEPVALKRLAMRHATRERELDVLLRGRRFVDLHLVMRQGLRASAEDYSLKTLEPFFGYRRAVSLKEEAVPALHRIARALQLDQPHAISPADRASVEGYNRDDCLSLVKLREWLEERRKDLLARGEAIGRPPIADGAAPESVEKRSAEVRKVFEALTEGLPDERASWSELEGARWLLAHLIEYFYREDKVAWWEYHARRDAEDEELWQDRKALLGLKLVGEIKASGRTPVHRYRFPPQEASVDEGDDIRDLRADISHDLKADEIGSVYAIDLNRGTIDIKKTKKAKERHPDAVHVFDRVPPAPLDGAILELARWVIEHGIDADGDFRAARDLLLRRPPRTFTPLGSALRNPSEPGLDAALRVARDLDGGVLAIQGPPGAGKTHTGARMILRLAYEDEKRVGVTAVSHKVVRKMLESVLEAARAENVVLEVTHKPSSKARRGLSLPGGMNEAEDNDEAIAALDSGRAVGGVAWLWASGEAEKELDYLFIDEAGQMSLAQVLAASRSARNLILLGDPQQLQQPQRGAHPEGAEVSALAHLLNGAATIPENLGLFLEHTWRLHPSICSFTSELFYDAKLEPLPGLERQALVGPTPLAGSGLFFVSVQHDGNQASAPEEVKIVARVIDALVRPGVQWVDRLGVRRDLSLDDLLVIAPYNAQVSALSRHMPDLVIGTVDRFQGQEKPVVIVSMTSSSATDAPRGMSFLFDPHRLNVATSRAQCACILVASPTLFEPECKTPEEIRWANILCRYLELAQVVELPAS